MDKPIKILLSGIACAGIIASGQVFYNRWLENQLKQIEAECIIERGERTWVCDAEELETVDVKGQGVQTKLVSAYRAVQQEKLFPRFFLIAAFIMVLSALPWLWYFLLRRIRELRDAILGK